MSDEIGLLRTDVEIESHTRPGERRLLRQVLVDTSAELSWAPAPVLESLGLTRVREIAQSNPRKISARSIGTGSGVSGGRQGRKSS